MKCLTVWLVRLYPQWWQQRYGAEYRALLEDIPLRPQDTLDVLFGALDAHMHLNHRRYAMQNSARFRRTGVTLLIVALLAIVGLFVPGVEPYAEMLIWFWPLLSMAAASALHVRFQERYPQRSHCLLRLAQVGLILMLVLLVDVIITQFIWGRPASLNWLLPVISNIAYIMLVVSFIVWVVITAITGWQTRELHPLLVAVGLLSGLLVVLNVLSIFVLMPSHYASLVFRALLTMNMVWLVGLGLSLFKFGGRLPAVQAA